MVKRSIAICSGGFLRVSNRQLVHERDNTVVNTAPLEDLALVVVDTPEVCWTSALLSECAEHGIAVVFCGAKHLPSGILMPSVGNHLMANTQRKPLEAKLPTKKRIWQTLYPVGTRASSSLLN